jgi:hypothetical protein
MKQILIVSMLYTVLAYAGADTIYLKGSGQQVSAVDAVRAEISGEEVYKCTKQALAVNEKSGSIRVKNKGKQLTKEQFEQKLKDLKERVGG